VEPGYVTDELVHYAAQSEIFCRHFHIPLQSGNDQVLRRMGRHYSTAQYGERVQQIAEEIPGCALGADVMVGFRNSYTQGQDTEPLETKLTALRQYADRVMSKTR